jgi:hypothetical protein
VPRKERAKKTRGWAGMDGVEGCRRLLLFSSSMSDDRLAYLRRHLNGVIAGRNEGYGYQIKVGFT